MVVETKYSYLMVWLWLLGIAVAFASIIFAVVGSVVCGLLLVLGGIAFLYSFYITHGRTLIFNEAGCTVRFRGEDTHILWNDIVVKRIEPQHFGGNREYTKGCVFFSLRPTKKNPRTDPAAYALLHPNTCFWVYFKSDSHGVCSNTPGIYEVDKEVFLEHLRKWGIELEIVRF